MALLLAATGPAPPQLQFYGDEAEQWFDEGTVEQVAIPSATYQQADSIPSPVEDAWNHWPTDDDEQPPQTDAFFNANLVVAASQPVEDAWDHWPTTDDDEQPPLDESQGSSVAVVAQVFDDAWDWWTDENVVEAAPSGGFQQQDLPTLQYFGEDAELLDQDDDEQALADDYQQGAVVIPPPQYFGDEAEHLAQEDDDQVAVDSQPTLAGDAPIEDAWDHFTTEDDDQASIDEFALISVPTTTIQYYGEDAETADADQDDEEWIFRCADTVPPDFFAPPQCFGEDAELAAQEEEELWALDEQISFPDALVPPDAWDHFDDSGLQDEAASDDYQSLALPQLPEDAWDHFPAEDDEQWTQDEFLSALPPNPALNAEDPWDHFLTDDADDYFVADDYALPAIGFGLMSGVAVCGGLSFGVCLGVMPQVFQLFDPRFFNGSNAWLGYRTSSGGGVW